MGGEISFAGQGKPSEQQGDLYLAYENNNAFWDMVWESTNCTWDLDQFYLNNVSLLSWSLAKIIKDYYSLSEPALLVMCRDRYH